jgi:hypothetical protein
MEIGTAALLISAAGVLYLGCVVINRRWADRFPTYPAALVAGTAACVGALATCSPARTHCVVGLGRFLSWNAAWSGGRAESAMAFGTE